jgi:16S rRNA (cytosine967-C5)-methyltransferase
MIEHSSAGRARAAAARAVMTVLQEGRSLTQALPIALRPLHESEERALAQELTYGTLRYAHQLRWLAARLLHHPIKTKDADLEALLLIGLYQLRLLQTPAHVAVTTTVEGCRHLKKEWACGLVNAVLRTYDRDRAGHEASIVSSDVARYSHPEWLIDRLRPAWPQQWREILAANNERPPLCLRVNLRQGTREDYQTELSQHSIISHAGRHVPTALTLEQPMGVTTLPGFGEGRCSAQDEAAQLAAALLNLQAGQRVLDACAAPGGKTTHLLESEPRLQQLIALDSDATRLQRLRENLQRLRLSCEIMVADAGNPQSWWDGRPYDRILLDAPCSAIGVIRRHPDIKSLRRPTDIAALGRTQQRFLRALWPLLARGGKLLYATCSILPDENQMQIQEFLVRQPDARVEAWPQARWGIEVHPGRQILPGNDQMDGFYYALLVKT